jgi:hypothetical protein
MSGETEEEARAPSRAGSMASSVFSGRTAESSYATEALSAEMKAELVKIILYRKMTGTMRESRTLVRSVNACQRAEAALLLVEVATSALDEIAEGDIPQGSVGQKDEMMFLQEIQQRDSKLLEMNVRCEEAEALRHEAENTILEIRTWRARPSQPLFATRTCVFCNQLGYGRLVIRRAVKSATLGL